ncbi:MAG: putative toxin-antitoxin system toxin component, PIN family [Thiobacillus sp.]
MAVAMTRMRDQAIGDAGRVEHSELMDCRTSLVLDTNVVLDLLLFDDPAARGLRDALDAGRLRCLVSDATFDEWQRVLGYPEFALDGARQAALAAAYRALADKTDAVCTMTLPRCSDPDDQKFLVLAAAARAAALVSKDRAVLRLRRRCAPWFAIVTPAEVGGLAMRLPALS